MAVEVEVEEKKKERLLSAAVVLEEVRDGPEEEERQVLSSLGGPGAEAVLELLGLVGGLEVVVAR